MEPFVDGGGGRRARHRKRQPAIMYVCSKVLIVLLPACQGLRRGTHWTQPSLPNMLEHPSHQFLRQNPPARIKRTPTRRRPTAMKGADAQSRKGQRSNQYSSTFLLSGRCCAWGLGTRPMGWRTFVLIYWCTQASVGKTEREHPLNQSVAETCGKFGRLCCTTSLPTF